MVRKKQTKEAPKATQDEIADFLKGMCNGCNAGVKRNKSRGIELTPEETKELNALQGTRTIEPTPEEIETMLREPNRYKRRLYCMNCLLWEGTYKGMANRFKKPYNVITNAELKYITTNPAPVCMGKPKYVKGKTVDFSMADNLEQALEWMKETTEECNATSLQCRCLRTGCLTYWNDGCSHKKNYRSD